MRVDLHNHTPRCKHASGSPSEFIARAKELGVDVYGFSCHAPMKFDEAYRMGSDELESYFAEIGELAQAEQGAIEVLCGLEVDFIKGKESLLEERVLQASVDYLIGSVHFLDTWGFDNPAFIAEYAKRDMVQCWREYLRAIKAMADSGLFQIVGHLDLLKVFGHTMPECVGDELESALESIAKAQMSIEINSAGLRKSIAQAYPSKEILSRAFAYKIPITFSSDAHSIEQVGAGYEQCLELAKEVGYTECVIYRKKRALTLGLKG